jgi:hypothetical protein
MKLRGLTAILTAASLGIVVLLLSHYFKVKDSPPEIKSQLTNSNEIEGQKPRGPTFQNLKSVIAKNLEKQSEMVERKDFDDSLLVQERFYTENEINEMTEPQFKSLLKDIELKLPLLSDLKKLPPGALHTTPAPVMQAGKDLGLIKEILKVHESYEREALVFYESCAGNAERPTPVRALCLTNLVIIKKKNGERVNLKSYPAQLVELTKMVTDL